MKSGDFAPPINKKTNDQLGVYQKVLEQAIKDDRFEEAANIRDQIDILISEQKNNPKP